MSLGISPRPRKKDDSCPAITSPAIRSGDGSSMRSSRCKPVLVFSVTAPDPCSHETPLAVESLAKNEGKPWIRSHKSLTNCREINRIHKNSSLLPRSPNPEFRQGYPKISAALRRNFLSVILRNPQRYPLLYGFKRVLWWVRNEYDLPEKIRCAQCRLHGQYRPRSAAPGRG